MFLAGFSLIAFAVWHSFTTKQTDYYTAIIPVIGGAITEFVAATALVVYQKSISQLNHYHQALHEDQRFLSSVNLIDKFHKEEI